MDRNADRGIVSFVVPAWNEERWLPASLAAIHRAAGECGRAHEIVVADDASTDRTAEVATAAGARVVSVEHRQIAATRNTGARAARGELLIFVDADTEVNPEVVAAALAALDGGAVGGGAGIEFDGRVPLWSRLTLPFFLFSFRLARLAAGCFLFCRRSEFEAVGGFDPGIFAGEEILLSRALRRRGRFVILREKVRTSGRKLRTHTGLETWRIFAGLAWRGERGLRSREHLDLWYRDDRRDPGAQGEPGDPPPPQ